MTLSAGAVHDLANGVLTAADRWETDALSALAAGRRTITGHWSGLASVQAQGALSRQSAATLMCVEALAGVGLNLRRLASALDEAAAWRRAGRRIADEIGPSLDSPWETGPAGGGGWMSSPDTSAAVRQLFDAAFDAEIRADSWCAGQITEAALLAPADYGAPAPMPIQEHGVGSHLWLDRMPSLDPILRIAPRLAPLRAAQPETTYVPGNIARAALQPAVVARDLGRSVAAREVAARLELRDESASPVAMVATRARNLLLPSPDGPRDYPLYDPKRGTIAEVVGDIGTARSVVVFVPGVGTSLDRWPVVSRQIEALYEALRAAGGEPVAVVGWLGSPTPPNVVGGALQSYAKDGARELKRFVDQLGLSAEVRLTLVGHSYGAVTAGLAIRDGVRPAAVVGVGGPGFGPGVHGIADLAGTPTYVLTDPNDPINEVQIAQHLMTEAVGLGIPVLGRYVANRTTGAAGLGHLGTDPVRLAGARRLSTGNDTASPLVATDVSAHTNYFVEGGLVDRQIAAVALGLPAEPYRGKRSR